MLVNAAIFVGISSRVFDRLFTVAGGEVSRSKKKNPHSKVSKCRSGEMKLYKRRANKRIRASEDVADGSSYKRNEERWMWPDDGRYYCPNDDKSLRK